MDTTMENRAYESLYKQLKVDYDASLANLLKLEDEKNKAIEQQQYLQTQNENLTNKLEDMEVTLNDMQNQITVLQEELEITKQSKGRQCKYSAQDAKKIHDSLRKYGGSMSFRAASDYFHISTSTIQLLLKKYC